MKRSLFRQWFPLGSLGCFFCGVDSTPILIFFIGLIGSLALGTVLAGIGFWMKGSFRNSEAMKNEIFEAERRV